MHMISPVDLDGVDLVPVRPQLRQVISGVEGGRGGSNIGTQEVRLCRASACAINTILAIWLSNEGEVVHNASTPSFNCFRLLLSD